MKRILCMLCAVALIFTFCACSNSDLAENEKSGISSATAISNAKNSKTVQDRIARQCGFKRYVENINWGICTAEEGDSYWYVTLKGEMTGITNEDGSGVESKTFSVTARVTNGGVVY